MSCFSCFASHEKKGAKKMVNIRDHPYGLPSDQPIPQPYRSENLKPRSPTEVTKTKNDVCRETGCNNISAETYTFRELATSTNNFRQECLIGEGGFGRVYKGKIEKTCQVVAVKLLDRNGLQGNEEFLVEVLMLSNLHHPNLVNLIGYCAEGEQRLLVYEYMPLGSLEDHLLDIPAEQESLNWSKRMKIAIGAAKGLEYLHDKANPPVIYRDLKSSNILLDKDYSAKLSDFGLARVGPAGEKQHVSSRVMGTYGYCAPEYQRTGQLTVKSDVYSFGVVLLELIAGKRVVDNMRPSEEQNLVSWAQPIFKDPQRFTELADPLLEGDYPVKDLNQVVAVAAMCLQEDDAARPMMSDVVTALSFLGSDLCENCAPASSPSPPSDHNILGTDSNPLEGAEREQAVAEAMEWGSASRCGSADSTAENSILIL